MLIQFSGYLSVGLLLVAFVSSAPAQTKTEPRKSGDAVQSDRSASGSSTNQYSDRDRRAGWEKGSKNWNER